MAASTAMNFAPLLLGIPLRVQPVQNSELLPAESERVWSAGKGMNCAHCERVVKNLEGYCAKQKPMGDLDLKCFDCTWAHHEMPGCAAIMEQIRARAEPEAQQTCHDCCLTKCSCLPTCDECICEDCGADGVVEPCPGPGHHVVRAATVEPPARKSHDNCDCECLDPVASKEALVGLRKFCASFELPHNMTWAADATCGVGGRYAVPPDFDRFCALHQPFADAADGRAQCQLFLQRLALSSRPEPAVLCELACEGWCDPCCPVGTPGMSCG